MRQIGDGVTKQKLIVVFVLAALVTGCAAGRAYRRGMEAARVGDWDSAVTHFTRAVQENPDSADYKIALQRAQQSAAQDHISRARALEDKDALDIALTEYRRAVELDPTNRLAAARGAELERIIRERIEASRPRPQIEALREQAARQGPPPLLNLRTRLKGLNFNQASVRDILNVIGTNAGISVTFDQQFQDRAYSIELEDVTVEEALQQIMSANQLFYKVINPKTIIVVNDRADKRQQYDEMVVKTFFVSHVDAQALAQMVTTIMRVPQMPVAPVVMSHPDKSVNSITVRGTTQIVNIIERIIRANDKPRAEVVIDVQILEVNRQRAKMYGINLNAYAVGLLFSPEVAPPNTSAPPVTAPPSPPPFNLNTISQGISTADFYMSIPTALVRFLESDSHTKTIAKPQLRGAEGTKLTLNLGDEIPVLQTVFGAAAAGGFASIPQSSYTYRPVGVIIEVTPRVTYDGEIVLELVVENSTLGGSIDVGGQSAPTFGTRKVTTKLRLREGESNLLAGLLREEDRRSLRGFPGLLRLPVFRQLLSDNDQSIQQTDIVMLLTPHIVRTHELTAQDLAPIYIGTQQNLGLGGPPPMIAPPPEPQVPQPATPAGPDEVIPTTPGVLPGGTARPPTAPPGTSPVPAPITPVPPVGGAPAAVPPGAATATPGVAPPVGAPATAPVTPPIESPAPAVPRDPAAPAAGPPPDPNAPATPAQVILTVPGTTFQVAGGPYTVPISINNATRLSVMTLTITYNPSVLRVRTVQPGSFMQQGGVPTSFTPRIDAATGRVDIAVNRTSDQVGATGAGLLAALLFDAVGPGSSLIQLSGVGSTPEGSPVALQFSPVTVTVR
jgi:type II secretory pathway component GspD/PulD (secretin)